MRKKRSKHAIPFKSTILIYCDGLTEKCYLQSLKADRYPGISIEIKPQLCRGDKFEDVFKEIGRLLDASDDEQYRFIFYLKDMDTVHNQGQLGRFQKLVEVLSKKRRAHNRLYVIESRPCFDFWPLLHFSSNDRLLTSYDELEIELRKEKIMKDYEKTEKYSEKLYAKLKDRLTIAINNSTQICSKQRDPKEEHSYTLMHVVIKLLDSLIVR